jgi:hypothetical protein
MNLSRLTLAFLLIPTLTWADINETGLPAKQPFTGLYAQVGGGAQSFLLKSTMEADTSAVTSNPTLTQSHSQIGADWALTAGYRFNLAQKILMGVGVLGEITPNQMNQSFDFTLSPSSGGPADYKITSSFSHTYSISPFVELAYAESKNLVSVFAGPNFTQMTTNVNFLQDGSVIPQKQQGTFTNLQTGLVLGSTVEHLITPSFGVFLRGMYAYFPHFVIANEDSTGENIINTTTIGAHTYTAQLGLEITFG